MKSKKEVLTFYLLIIIVLVASFFAPNVLPEKYISDAVLIIEDPNNEKGRLDSYGIIMSFYHYTGLGKLNYNIIALIQIIIISILVRRLGIPKNFHRFFLSNFVVAALIFIMPVYLSIPTKEFLNVIFIYIIVRILKEKEVVSLKKLAFLITLFFLFGYFYRIYYVLIPPVAIAVSAVSKLKTRFKLVNIFLTSILICVFISFSYGLVKGEYMSYSTREKINEQRINESNAQTAIVSPVKPDSLLGESTSIFYGYFSVNFPVEGLKFYNKPQALLFVFWQFSLITALLINFSKEIKFKRRTQQKWIFYFLISYLAIQGIFEPDLGSSIRHKLGILPLIYEAMFYNRSRY